jgi:biotin-dependent carboxylase-like uncharacterized protein
MSLKIIKPGIYSLLQDGGRYGYHSMGITSGGPLDRDAFRWANILCENPPESAAIEITVGGLIIESTIKTTLALTGADIPISINKQPVELWQSHAINPGDRIELGFARKGSRGYLAVKGGFKVEPIFKSIATVPREGLGGLNADGSPLKAGDILPCEPTTEQTSQWQLPEHLRPDYPQNSVSLRVILGYQQDAFSDAQKQQFFNTQYTVSKNCDRMGYRLDGPEISPAIDGILSEGICLGAIQFPADGQPIILLNDRQTMGGYPKIGSLLSVDIGKLAQLSAGSQLRFEALSIDQAQSLLINHEKQFLNGPGKLIKTSN